MVEEEDFNRLVSDVEQLKERVSRHSGRINTLEQNQLQEKGELAALKVEMRVMDATLKEVQQTQQTMIKETKKTQNDIRESKEYSARVFKRIVLVFILSFVIIFAKDSSLGAKLSTLLTAVRAIGV